MRVQLYSSLALGLLAFSVSVASADISQTALPTGAQAVSGISSISQVGSTLNVNASAARSAVNYQTFNVGSRATVNFNLPSASSSILNRVVTGAPSTIAGRINSNGNVILVNPSGVVFSGGSTTNVGGLTVSTLGIDPQSFLGGSNTYSRSVNGPVNGIWVQPGANINTRTGGRANFVTSSFLNQGNITAPSGAVNVAVGDRVTINDVVGATIDVPLQRSLGYYSVAIQNEGNISANSVKLIAKSVEDNFKSTIVNTGQIRATDIVGRPGAIELVSDRGYVSNYGTLDASSNQGMGGRVLMQGDTTLQVGTVLARGYNGRGGQIDLLGRRVGLGDYSFNSASGATGGGNINVGNFNTSQTYVAPGAQLYANAYQTGNGGNIRVLSNNDTQYYGYAQARGGY